MNSIPAGPDHDRDFADRIRRSVERGLITAEQADAIIADQVPAADPSPADPTPTATIESTGPAEPAEPADGDAAPADRPVVRGSIVAEALGYVGGVLVLIGAVTIALNFWEQIGITGRLTVIFGAAAVLLIAGAAMPARRAQVARRLRSVCWLLAVVLVGTGLSVLVPEVFRLERYTGVLSAGGAAVVGAVLWWLHRTVAQQAITVIAVALAVSSAATLLPRGYEFVPGLAVWGLGVAWLLLAEGSVIAARRAGTVLGGAAAVIGSLGTVGATWGAVLAIGTAVVLVAAGVWLRNLVLLALGAIALLLSVPMVVGQYFPDVLPVSMALLGCGVLLVVGGILMARSRRIRPSEPARAALARTPATAAAAGVAVVTTIAVLLLGS